MLENQTTNRCSWWIAGNPEVIETSLSFLFAHDSGVNGASAFPGTERGDKGLGKVRSRNRTKTSRKSCQANDAPSGHDNHSKQMAASEAIC